ncbi:phosphate ABC transporter permease PstA [Paenibacillus sp. 1P07SE]|uniref:phosphate ABC transporter permease PstA n=1 Tax=Paenibacillus sp. 1P07SE TaxID=3132209 RepID=UPI0039A5609C
MMFNDDKKALNRSRRRTDLYLHLIFLASTSFGIVCLTALIVDVLVDGLGALSPQFFTNYPSRRPAEAGILSAIVGTGYMVALMAPISLIFGVGAAIYLEEYAPKNKLTRLVQVNISTLAGVPSIVYGMLGLTLFVRAGGFEVLAMGRSILAGALTMSLLVLPIIIVSAQEAIRAIPRSRRDASFALGANKWQTVQKAVLPSAIPGILTGIILALSRAIGETAPLIMIGALTFVAFLPDNPLDQFTVMPIQIYNWVSRPQADFHQLAAAGIIVLLALLILMNLSAVLIRNKYQKKN